MGGKQGSLIFDQTRRKDATELDLQMHLSGRGRICAVWDRWDMVGVKMSKEFCQKLSIPLNSTRLLPGPLQCRVFSRTKREKINLRGSSKNFGLGAC